MWGYIPATIPLGSPNIKLAPCHTEITPAHLDVLQEDPATAVVLEGHELLGVLPLLMAVLLEEGGEARQCYVVTAEIESLGTGRESEMRGIMSVIERAKVII